MLSNQSILLASLKTDLKGALRREAEHRQNWRLAGPVDPRAPDVFVSACAAADVVLIEAEDLLWLWDNQPEATVAALQPIYAAVILSDRDLLRVMERMHTRHGLLLRRPADASPVDLLSLAIEGYVVLPEALLRRVASNRLRLDIIDELAPEVRQTLGYLGAAFSNRHIAEVSGMAESRVKTLVHIATRRLRLSNRTAVAVFVATNGLANVPDSSALS